MTLDLDILGARILIIGDHAANIQCLMRLLTEAGHTNLTATTRPTDVCALHHRLMFDLILLDQRTPGVDGFGILEALKANVQASPLPVIVLTAPLGHKLIAVHAGAKGIISTPFDLLEVKARIRTMLEVRVLYRQLEGQYAALQKVVGGRAAELRHSEAR